MSEDKENKNDDIRVGYPDCCFSFNDNWFRYRTGAIIIEDNSFLVVKSETSHYYYSIGGGVHMNEKAEDCVVREVKEETGLTLNSFSFRGIVTFVYADHPAEYMCLYTSSDFSGSLIECSEGELKWVQKDDLLSLNLWEGDKIFLRLLTQSVPFFSLKLIYNQDGALTGTILDGKPLIS